MSNWKDYAVGDEANMEQEDIDALLDAVSAPITTGLPGPSNAPAEAIIPADKLAMIHMAMMEELGIGRKNALPLADRGPEVFAPAKKTSHKGNKALANHWKAFDDFDDSLQDLDNMHNGQLYRLRREQEAAANSVAGVPNRGGPGGRGGRGGRGGQGGRGSLSGFGAHGGSSRDNHTFNAGRSANASPSSGQERSAPPAQLSRGSHIVTGNSPRHGRHSGHYSNNEDRYGINETIASLRKAAAEPRATALKNFKSAPIAGAPKPTTSAWTLTTPDAFLARMQVYTETPQAPSGVSKEQPTELADLILGSIPGQHMAARVPKAVGRSSITLSHPDVRRAAPVLAVPSQATATQAALVHEARTKSSTSGQSVAVPHKLTDQREENSATSGGYNLVDIALDSKDTAAHSPMIQQHSEMAFFPFSRPHFEPMSTRISSNYFADMAAIDGQELLIQFDEEPPTVIASATADLLDMIDEDALLMELNKSAHGDFLKQVSWVSAGTNLIKDADFLQASARALGGGLSSSRFAPKQISAAESIVTKYFSQSPVFSNLPQALAEDYIKRTTKRLLKLAQDNAAKVALQDTALPEPIACQNVEDLRNSYSEYEDLAIRVKAPKYQHVSYSEHELLAMRTKAFTVNAHLPKPITMSDQALAAGNQQMLAAPPDSALTTDEELARAEAEIYWENNMGLHKSRFAKPASGASDRQTLSSRRKDSSIHGSKSRMN